MRTVFLMRSNPFHRPLAPNLAYSSRFWNLYQEYTQPLRFCPTENVKFERFSPALPDARLREANATGLQCDFSKPKVGHVTIHGPLDKNRICLGHRGVWRAETETKDEIAYGPGTADMAESAKVVAIGLNVLLPGGQD